MPLASADVHGRGGLCDKSKEHLCMRLPFIVPFVAKGIPFTYLLKNTFLYPWNNEHCYIARVFLPLLIYWVVHGHITFNNETVYHLML